MSSSVFKIKEHVVESQHIREYARATANSQEDVLQLSVKQYIPLDNPNPQAGDLTIIGTHANGFAKEMYEPLWEDLHAVSKTNGFRIRSIWIADVTHQGASGVLNEKLLGNDPSWLDHARDLLHLVNQFRSEMPAPLVGIGHSFGGNALVNLALIHPRLLSTLVLLDPVIQEYASSPVGPNPVQLSTFRRDFWPSRSEAETAMRKQKYYQSWDPRVLDRWLQFGLRETPSLLYPEKGVTLTTTKHQECFTFMRPSWEGLSADGDTLLSRDLVPDMDMDNPIKYPLYRPEPPNTLVRLGHLRPSVLYLFGETSNMSPPVFRKQKMDTTGMGVGGSGGAKEGRVEEYLMKGLGHLVAMEAPGECAEKAGNWLGREAQRFKKEREIYEEWTRQSLASKSMLSDEWKKRIGGPLKPPRGKL